MNLWDNILFNIERDRRRNEVDLQYLEIIRSSFSFNTFLFHVIPSLLRIFTSIRIVNFASLTFQKRKLMYFIIIVIFIIIIIFTLVKELVFQNV